METETINRKEELHSLKEDVARLQEDLTGLLRSAGEETREILTDKKIRLQNAISSLKMKAKEKIALASDNVKEYGKKAADTGRDTIKERPFTAIGVAFLTGLIVATLIRRR